MRIDLREGDDSFILCANQTGGPVKNQRGLQGAKRLFFVQISLVAVFSLLVWGMTDTVSARSFILGGVVWVIPQIFFALVLFKDQRARYSRAILTRVYKGEAFKLLLSALLFAGVFRFGQVVPLTFFMGYFLAQVLSWLAPLFFRTATAKTGMKVV